MQKFGRLGLVALAMLTALALPASAADRWNVSEPKKIKTPKSVKPGEGALQLSVRTQTQTVHTAMFYFVGVDENGHDTDQVIRFERGAGVPVMGSNMIDEKQQVYRVPAGRYRPLAFTVACDEMPTQPGLVCGGTVGVGFPTGFYPEGSALFEVKEGEFTRAGDFIVEYIGKSRPGKNSFLEKPASPTEWAMKWREGTGAPVGFEALPINEATVPEEWRSRITCNARPQGVLLYIPFDC